jgi:hypothetical protein
MLPLLSACRNILDEMLSVGALVTVERVRVLKYAAAPRRDSKKQSEP